MERANDILEFWFGSGPWTAERLNERTFVAILQPLWTLPCIIALRYWSGVFEDKWGTYILVMVLLSYPYCRMFIRLSLRNELTV